MKRLFALLLALCLCMGLCACGSSADASQGATTDDGLYEKSGTMDDGTVFTTWRKGGPEGTPVKLIYDTPDGFHHESYYNDEGVVEYSIDVEPDGSTYELCYYPSGNMEKSIYNGADGSFEELHYLDNGYTDENGWLCSGTVTYEKRISADGLAEEWDENIELQEDGTWWTTTDHGEGSVMRTHYNQDGITIESYWDIAAMGKHFTYLYYENGNQKSVEVVYDNSSEYNYDEYYEDGSLKYRHMIDYGGLVGTEHEEKISPVGYSTYLLLKHPQSDTVEYFADDNGNLEKFVKNGTVYEGNAIPGNDRKDWENIRTVPPAKATDSVTEQMDDGTYWVTTTYDDGKVEKQHFNADDVLIAFDNVEANGDRYYQERYDSGQTKYELRTFGERVTEFAYDEEGYETYFHQYGEGGDLEMITDETGKLVAVLMDGTEMKTTDPLYEHLLTGHNFRSR